MTTLFYLIDAASQDVVLECVGVVLLLVVAVDVVVTRRWGRA